MPADQVIGIALVAIAILLAILVGSSLLRRALARKQRLPEEMAISLAWVFVVGGLVWLSAFLRDATLLGFGAPWTWLAAAHFGAAGFGALTVTALTCRVVSDLRALRILRGLLVFHPIVYLVTAASIADLPYCDGLGAVGYELLFLVQLGSFAFGRPERMPRGPRILLGFALTVPVITLLLSLAWAWERPIFDLTGMVRYHGVVNAVGHVGLGLLAFAWGRPRAQAPVLAERST